jgi:TolA-binding protein
VIANGRPEEVEGEKGFCPGGSVVLVSVVLAMNAKVKLTLYVILIACMGALIYGFRANYANRGEPGPAREKAIEAADARNATAAAGTTNATNVGNSTNAVEQADVPAVLPGDEVQPLRKRSPRMGRLTAYAIGMFFTLIGLAVLIAHDVSRFMANRVDSFIFNDDLSGVKHPDYEEAENVWATGDHLEAIRLMRDYLERYPREQYVALRIAEIYENDLHNHLASALEYEEVLKKRLPAERWGWVAIHLANLYSGKLNRTEEATALLRRTVEEYGQTAAAKKARQRLGIPEPGPEPSSEPDSDPALSPGAGADAADADSSSTTDDDKEGPSGAGSKSSASKLPPGFRPKT